MSPEDGPGAGAERGPRVGAVLLAAGSSRRMGHNKLLADVGGRPLLRRAAETALASRASALVVVTGHEAERVGALCADLDVQLVHNPDHARGLARSLRVGIEALPGSCEGALICLADMPWLLASHLDALIEGFATRPERPICVPVHAGRRGNPRLWPARHFPALCALEGDVGGRTLLEGLEAEVVEVPIADAAIHRDIDTPADLPTG